MLFHNNSAPTGWTKKTASNWNNRALRMVTGNVGTGGSNDFTTAFNSSRGTSGGSVSNHTLTTAQLASHRHKVDTNNEWNESHGNWSQVNDWRQVHTGGTHYKPWTSYEGSGNSHSHGFTNPSFNLNVKYHDVIIATKD